MMASVGANARPAFVIHPEAVNVHRIAVAKHLSDRFEKLGGVESSVQADASSSEFTILPVVKTATRAVFLELS